MSFCTIKMSGREYDVPDSSEWAFIDFMRIREATGMSTAKFQDALCETPPDMTAIAGLAYMVMRRDDPSVTLDDVAASRVIDFAFTDVPDEKAEDQSDPLVEEASSSSEKTLVASGSQPSQNGGV